MDTVLLNPNIAYLFLAGGVLLTFFALVTPGTGFLEIGAFFLMALAGYAIYSLPIHIWALVILTASLLPFVMAIRQPHIIDAQKVGNIVFKWILEY